jgi:hypothetical protein
MAGGKPKPKAEKPLDTFKRYGEQDVKPIPPVSTDSKAKGTKP